MIRIRSFCTKAFSEFSKEISVNELSNGVFDVRLNRPKTQNSFNFQLWRDITSVFNFLSDYSKCRCVVLSGGNSKSFSSGIDLTTGITELFEILNDNNLDTARKARHLRSIIKTAQNGFTAVEKCEKPVICAIHGYCIGAGVSLASCCDIRYSTADALFTIKEVDIGIAADVGILQRIQYLVGNDSWSRELAYTGREFSGSEAFKLGFCSRVFDTKDECFSSSIDLATRIAEKSPVAVQGAKLAMNYARNHGVDDSLDWQLTWNQSQLQTDDIILNAAAKMKKEKAQFKDV